MTPRGKLRFLRSKGHWIALNKPATDPETFMPCPRCELARQPFVVDCWSCRIYNKLSNQALAVINCQYYANT